MGKGTKNDFLSQKLRKLWGTGIKYLALLTQSVILFFACMTEMLLKGARVEVVGLWSGTFSNSCSYDMSSTSKYKQSVSFRKCK